MNFTHLSGYKFIALTALDQLCQHLSDKCVCLELRGTILCSEEGININIAGVDDRVEQFADWLLQDARFQGICFKRSLAPLLPFKRLRIKVKPYIINMGTDAIKPQENRALRLSPEKFKQWLDEKKDMALLDVRNQFECKFGTFKNAVTLPLNVFNQFEEVINDLGDRLKKKPMVTFCTGGIRCEKAALLLKEYGFEEVYQLEGGILNYFSVCGGAYFEGECFVFDERVALNDRQEATGTVQCPVCFYPVNSREQAFSSYIAGVSCSQCAKSIGDEKRSAT